MHIVVHIF